MTALTQQLLSEAIHILDQALDDEAVQADLHRFKTDSYLRDRLALLKDRLFPNRIPPAVEGGS